MKHIVIPARFSSSRLPGKPLLKIHDREMILRVVDQARNVEGFDSLCVATDDERIAQICCDANVDVVITNPNHPSGTDRLSEVARIKGWAAEDIIVNVQGDEPLLPAQLVQQVADLLIQKPHCSMSTLCEPIHRLDEFQRDSIVKVVMTQFKEALYFSRATIPYDRDGAKLENPQLHQNEKACYYYILHDLLADLRLLIEKFRNDTIAFFSYFNNVFFRYRTIRPSQMTTYISPFSY